ncbi:DNA phosphorothioation system sulfurtransferase DndC [uncultured Draconibacterium sp.]|uniref:DNA phosphorothioation system sulfurtransferase DndC n=1 Tax=uncultured Draconibacterium sp. TaxID=1573823 RepID=UPI0025CEF5E6|nr:DNA phosphorothioation system sulfurtransferase DndC [uncultured Draconibacterium sp.]
MKNKKIEHIINEIVDQYCYADSTEKPWIIGFSGGKDSTVLLTLVWEALLKVREMPTPFQLKRPVYVVCNDTLVENPIVVEYVERVLNKINIAAREQDLPIFVKKTIPRLEDSFWVNIIGKGYPVPNNAFRWCTDKLKIKPTSRFIKEQVADNGEAIILIGTRSAESATRAKSIKKHEIKGKRLTKHPNESNTFVYAPIRHLMLEEVWGIINGHQSPWGANNSELFNIYANASADDYECPTMVTNKEHSSCGQSRFGCWTCTVVKVDKSMSALINNGFEWLNPLLQLRNVLDKERNEIKNRMPTRRDGSPAVNELGTYWPAYRASILKRVLETQKQLQETKPHLELITNQELIAIQVIWNRDLFFDKKVSQIYNAVFNIKLDMKDKAERQEKENQLLLDACKNDDSDFNLIQDLLQLQKSKTLMIRKRGLQADIENRLERFIKDNN